VSLLETKGDGSQVVIVGGGEGYTVVLDPKSRYPLRDDEGTGDRGFHDVDDGGCVYQGKSLQSCPRKYEY
jgi:hypothetical protein